MMATPSMDPPMQATLYLEDSLTTVIIYLQENLSQNIYKYIENFLYHLSFQYHSKTFPSLSFRSELYDLLNERVSESRTLEPPIIDRAPNWMTESGMTNTSREISGFPPFLRLSVILQNLIFGFSHTRKMLGAKILSVFIGHRFLGVNWNGVNVLLDTNV